MDTGDPGYAHYYSGMMNDQASTTKHLSFAREELARLGERGFRPEIVAANSGSQSWYLARYLGFKLVNERTGFLGRNMTQRWVMP